MQHITTVGIDLAKKVRVCDGCVTGAVVYSKVLKREAFIVWAEQLPPSTVVMEACGSAHHWGRWFVQGARSTLQSALKQGPERGIRLQRWIIEVYGRVGYHKTLIAIANKHARMLWAMQAKDEAYDPQVSGSFCLTGGGSP